MPSISTSGWPSASRISADRFLTSSCRAMSLRPAVSIEIGNAAACTSRGPPGPSTRTVGPLVVSPAARRQALVEDPEARAVASAERALLAALDGSCRTPIGGYAHLLPNGELHISGLVARPDGSFLLRRRLHGQVADAARIGAELGASLRADSPRDIFA